MNTQHSMRNDQCRSEKIKDKRKKIKQFNYLLTLGTFNFSSLKTFSSTSNIRQGIANVQIPTRMKDEGKKVNSKR